MKHGREVGTGSCGPVPRPALEVVFAASSEVRGSIIYATILVILVFTPMFALGGIEGWLFTPLGQAYVISILASFIVSLDVTPALCLYLLPNAKATAHGVSAFVRWLKRNDRRLLERVLDHPRPVIVFTALAVVAAAAIVPFLGKEFLPPFNEGTATVNVIARPGTSLDESNRLGTMAENLLHQVRGDLHRVPHRARRIGRTCRRRSLYGDRRGFLALEALA